MSSTGSQSGWSGTGPSAALGDRSVIFSCVKRPWLGPEWLGREITWETLAELRILSAANGLDLCGENGEFHTLALNGPLFRYPVQFTWTPEHTEEMSWVRVG